MEPIGRIDAVEGEAYVVRENGRHQSLEVGDPVYQGEEIVTENGAVSIVFMDQSIFSLDKYGNMVMDEMIYDADDQSGSMSLSITQGIATYVSGMIAKTDPDAMELRTPVATIGIRGTQVGVDVQRDGSTEVVLMEEWDGYVGEVVIQNQADTLVINQVNQSVDIVSETEQFLDFRTMTETEINIKYGTTMNLVDQTIQMLDEEIEEIEESSVEELADFETAAGEEEDETASITLSDEQQFMMELVDMTIIENEFTDLSITVNEDVVERNTDEWYEVVEENDFVPVQEQEQEPTLDLDADEQAVRDYFASLGIDAVLDDGVLTFNDDITDVNFTDELVGVLEGQVDTINLTNTDGTVELSTKDIITISGDGSIGIRAGEEQFDRASWEFSHEDGYTVMTKSDDVVKIDHSEF